MEGLNLCTDSGEYQKRFLFSSKDSTVPDMTT